MTPLEWVAVVIIGLVVGLVPGLFGVGGGFLTVPLLNMFAGVPLPLCVGTATVQALGPVTTGMLYRHEQGKLDWQLALMMLGGTQIGLQLGIDFLRWAADPPVLWTFAGRSMPRIDVILYLTFLVLLVVLAVVTAVEYRLSRHGQDERLHRGLLEHWPLPPHVPLPELDGRPVSLAWLALLSLLIGFLNGGLGMGGAIVVTPALIFLFGLSTHRAITTTLVLSWSNGLAATFVHAWVGNVDLPLAGVLLVASAAGGRIGSRISERLSGRSLRGYFSLLIVVGAVLVAGRLLWG